MSSPSIQQSFQLALQHHQAGRLQQAEQIYRQILTDQPHHAEALHLLGVLACQTGRFDLAVDLNRSLIALKANSPEAHSNLGSALRGNGNLDQAIAAFRQALALKPDYPEAHNNLATALREMGLLDEAIAACRQAVALQPGFAVAHCNLGIALLDHGRLDEAIAALRQAIALKPIYPEAHRFLGNALKDMGLLDEAIAAFRQAIAIKPHYPEAHSNLICTLLYHPAYDARSIAEEQLRWNRQYAQPLRPLIQPHPHDRATDRPLRIGYVSADFRTHASAFFLLPLLEHHDRRHVEPFCYAQVPRPDEITRRLQQNAHWRNIVALSDEHVATQIREDRIDILVDLKLHTPNNRLLIFARKPAPLQVTWLGYPGSTGLNTIDYRLSDPHLDPPGMDESIYSEQTIRLPHTFWCYDPLDNQAHGLQSVGSVGPLPALANGHITFGCLNNFCKINPGVLALWSRILIALPTSRLLVLAHPGSHRQKILDTLAIDPARVEFLPMQPRDRYLQTFHRIDISLDPFPYNGHTTSLDSLYMGVPIITLTGPTIVNRAGVSQLSNLNLPDLIASTPDQYIQIAATLASDLPRLANLRATLRPRMKASPLMDAKAFAQDIESAYRQVWQAYCRSHP